MTSQDHDQYASGTSADGEPWSVARYGSLVVARIGDQDDDLQLTTEDEAIAEFAGLVHAWSGEAR